MQNNDKHPSGLDIPVSRAIWSGKYRFGDEATIHDTQHRVAKALAAAEPKDQSVWESAFFDAMAGFRFIPAGRVLAGAGTGRKVTLFNCFVLPTIPDSMNGIFSVLKAGALTMQQGGGIGTDFSTLRPKGALVQGVGADASGPLSFMDCWDAMCRTIMSAGSRRGAMMGTLRCDHPDIEAFVDAKLDRNRFRNFNLSVLVTDPFMAAVETDAPWDLVFEGKVYQTVSARALFDKITRNTYDSAEPGVIFIDRINAANNLGYAETIACTNPCSEQPLPPNGACLLGSINLAALVKNPFTAEAGIDPNELGELTGLAVRMLDNVIDISGYPLPEQKTEATLKRRIGLGITGLGSALAMCGWQYGSSKGRAAAQAWMRHVARTAYTASIKLAEEKGPFPLYDPAQYRIAEALEIGDAPLRNSHLISIAPTGTISLLAGNVSSGIEPIFDWEYQREVLQPDGSKRTEIVEDFAVRTFRELHGQVHGVSDLPEQFHQRAGDLTPKHHLVMQSALQPFVDSAISKTINCPKDMPFEAFKRVYYQAYELGLKGVATYRPNDITGSVLAAVEEKPKPEPKPAPALAYPPIPSPRELAPRPEALPGKTYKLRWPANDAALYVTINSDLETRRPFEIFISSRNLEFATWTAALTRLISGIWRRGGDTNFVIEELRAVHDPRGGAWIGGVYVPSVLAAIGNVIERHCIDLEEGIDTSEIPQAGEDWFKRARLVLPKSQPVDLKVNDPGPAPGRFCPRCSSANVREKPGCLECRECGFSNCS